MCLKQGGVGRWPEGESRFHEGGNLIITSKTRETRHSGALSRVQDKSFFSKGQGGGKPLLVIALFPSPVSPPSFTTRARGGFF